MPKKKRLYKPSTIKLIALNLQKRVKQFSKFSFKTKAFFLFGLLFLFISLFWHLNQTIQLAFFTPQVIPIQKTHALPILLLISKVGTTLPIEQTAITNGIWQVSENVSHLTTSARPGEEGPIIMYGHNTDNKLGPIRWLSKGDTIEIKTEDNKIYTYVIQQTMTVAPDRLDIFIQQKGEILILYTCDGFADLQRFVVIAKPQ